MQVPGNQAHSERSVDESACMRSPAAISAHERHGVLDGWVDSPLSPPAVAPVATESRVERLVQILEVLSIQLQFDGR